MERARLADAANEHELVAALVAAGEQLPFNRHLGVTVDHAEVGCAEVRLPADPRLTNHLGGVHAIAELAPVELAAAIAVSSRLSAVVARGWVPVVAGMQARFRAPAQGDLVATAVCGPESAQQAEAALDMGDRPRVNVAVTVNDANGTVVLEAEVNLAFVQPNR